MRRDVPIRVPVMAGKGMQPKAIETAVEDLIRPILEADNVEVVDVVYRSESGRWTLRVFIDRPGGVTIDDCAHVSRRIGDRVEVEGLIPHRYVLEVSSPGPHRRLKTEEDFLRFAGERASVKTRLPRDGRRNYKGTIAGCAADVLELRDAEGTRFAFPLDEIEKARLESEPVGLPDKVAGTGRKKKRPKGRSGG